MNQLPDIDIPTWIRTVSQAETASAQTTVENVFFKIASPSSDEFIRFRRAVAILLLLGQQEVVIKAVDEMHAGIRPDRFGTNEISRFRSSEIDKAVKIANSLSNCFATDDREPNSQVKARLEAVLLEHSARLSAAGSSLDTPSNQQDHLSKNRL